MLTKHHCCAFADSRESSVSHPPTAAAGRCAETPAPCARSYTSTSQRSKCLAHTPGDISNSASGRVVPRATRVRATRHYSREHLGQGQAREQNTPSSSPPHLFGKTAFAAP